MPMRDGAALLGLALLAAVVVVGFPVALRVRDLMDSTMLCSALVAGPATLVACIGLLAWAWKNRPPPVGKEVIDIVPKVVDMGSKAIEAQRKAAATLPAPEPETWVTSRYIDATQERQ